MGIVAFHQASLREGYAELFTFKMDFGLQNLKHNARSGIWS